VATYFVASGGSNTSPYDTWAKASTSLATALAAATTDGDVVVIQYDAVPSGDAEMSADTTYTVAGDIFLISASNDGGSSYTPTAMGTSNWIGNSTTNRSIAWSGADNIWHAYGLTLRTAGSTVDSIYAGASSGNSTWENCYFWNGNTAASSRIRFVGVSCYRDCTFQFGHTSQGFEANTDVTTIIGGSISSSGSTPSVLFPANALQHVTCVGVDLSLITGTLVPNTAFPSKLLFDRCKLGSGVVPLAAQTSNPTLVSPEVWISDCNSGDTHNTFGYYNAMGQVTSDTGIYYTSGAAGQSWKIVTTSLASPRQPFITPWIDLYHTGISAITPYLEILRDGSTTAYKDHEVWAEFSAKVTSGSTLATSASDAATLANRMTAGGSDQAAGAGTGSWTGEGGTAWSGKCDSGSAFTPAEVGYIRGRIAVAAASTTVYVDPQIRT